MSDDEGSIMEDFEDDCESRDDDLSENDDIGIVPDDDLSGPSQDVKFKVLSPEELVADLMDNIKTTAQIIQLKPTHCRIMLQHFKYDKERLLESYYECSDQDEFFRAAHMVSPFQNQKRATSSKSSSGSVRDNTKSENCQICFTSLPIYKMASAECGHQFCVDCWDGYLTQKILGEGVCDTIQCPQHKCDIIVDDELALRLIKSEDIKRIYDRLITKSYVECNNLLTWCPNPDCPFVIRAERSGSFPVTCNCKFTFCFCCGHEWHDPITCRLLKRWVKKCSDDSETSNWIAANTKECPKCNTTIEKDGGCNHMTCKTLSCRYEFCWSCMGPWEPHGNSWYACNKYDDSRSKSARDAQEKSRQALARYLHYYNRYMNHERSSKLEQKLNAKAKSKMEALQSLNMSWIEVQFVQKAVDILTQCRHTLMYTYAFAYYLVKDNQAAIFEQNQGDLELATEILSGYLENDMQDDELANLKQKIQDKCSYIDERRKRILQHCHAGYDNFWWHFDDTL